MSDEISSLESQLREKEQLVSALTERLEQAAEQLDRIHRTGGDRGMRTGGGAGIPPELIEEQRTLVADLQEAIKHWDEMQPGVTLGRIEVQITELRDLVSGHIGEGGILAPGAHLPQPSSSVGAPESRSDTAPPAVDSSLDSYEAMKAAMLGAETPPPEPESSEPVVGDPESTVAADAAPLPEYEEITLVDPPEALDLDHADLDELRKGIEGRDSYISYLTQKLRAAESRYRGPTDWDALNNAPDDLRNSLEELQTKLGETLRHAEVDHALERARLARESMRLEQLEQQIQKEMKRLDLSTGGDAAGEENTGQSQEASHTEDGASNRWERLFGKK